MRNFVDLTGRQFGQWTVLSRSAIKTRPIYWACKCKCGTIKEVQGGSLKNGTNKSCAACSKTTHGGAYSSTYRSWINMKQRCVNQKHPQYKDYGGRGIAFCSEWSEFSKFIADMGEKPDGLFLERKSNALGYFKDNCEWATRKMQGRNTRATRLSMEIAASIRASTKSNTELAKEYGVTAACIYLVRENKTWK